MHNQVVLAIAVAAGAFVPARPLFAQRDSIATVVVGPEQTAQVTILYERPVTLGKPVLGGLVPFGVPWRLGSDSPAELRTLTSLQIGDLWLARGTYFLWAVPTADDATLVVSRQRARGGEKLDPATEVGRVKLVVDSVETSRDQFTMRLIRVRTAPDEIGSTMNKSGTHETIYIRSGVQVSLWIGWDRFVWTATLTAPDTLRHQP